MFQVECFDGLARVGRFEIRGHEVRTPTIAIVVNPNIQKVSARDLKRAGVELVITNAYIIKRSEHAREIEKRGVKSFLGWDGPVYTDSGTFQMYSRGGVEITNRETIEYQKLIGSDILTPLDVFTLPGDDEETAREKLGETMKRAREAMKNRGDRLLNLPVQGGLHLGLRKRAARMVSRLEPDVISIGGIVPLMEAYQFSDLVRVVMTVKQAVDPSIPLHAFGAGHPMVFSLLALCGVDLFDSAAYAIFARNGKYLTPYGTRELSELVELPCSCPACVDKSPREITEEDLALHNLYVTMDEIRRVRNAIREGSLFELVEQRVRAHPSLVDAYRVLLREYGRLLEGFEPVSKKRAFFVVGRESLSRPESLRGYKRLRDGYSPPNGKRVIILSGWERSVYSTIGEEWLVRHPVFGLVPASLVNVYPLGQTVWPLEMPSWESGVARKRAGSLLRAWGLDPTSIEWRDVFAPSGKRDWLGEVRATLDYQYGPGTSGMVDDSWSVVVSRSTRRIRLVKKGGETVGSIRASDGVFIPSEEGARLLHSVLPSGRYRVVIDEEAVPFVREGKSVFSRFVVECDDGIVPGDEVLVVDRENGLVGFGTAVMPGSYMTRFKRGVAVKTRGGIKQ